MSTVPLIFVDEIINKRMIPKTENAITELGKSNINEGKTKIPIVLVTSLPRCIPVPITRIERLEIIKVRKSHNIAPIILIGIKPNNIKPKISINIVIIKLFDALLLSLE